MKKIVLASLGMSLLFGAESTMCFKQNWAFLANIETTPLDGGECKGKKSVEDMQKDGWNIADIKINQAKMGMDYLYIFKKGAETVVSQNIVKESQIQSNSSGVLVPVSGSSVLITEELLKQISAKKDEKEKVDKDAKLLVGGEKLYKQTCANCHGDKGESTAYHTSRALNKMSEEDIVYAIRGYNLNDYDKGMAYLMAPYANFMTKEDALSVSKYLKSINK